MLRAANGTTSLNVKVLNFDPRERDADLPLVVMSTAVRRHGRMTTAAAAAAAAALIAGTNDQQCAATTVALGGLALWGVGADAAELASTTPCATRLYIGVPAGRNVTSVIDRTNNNAIIAPTRVASPPRDPLFVAPVLDTGLAAFGARFASCLLLDLATNTRLFWTINATHIVLGASTTASAKWLSVALSSDGTMTSNGRGSDAIVAFSCSGGKACVFQYDLLSTEGAQPRDAVDDLRNVELLVDSGALRFVAVRRLATGDASDFDINRSIDSIVLWARGTDQPTSDGKFEKHTHKGAKRVAWSSAGACSTTMSAPTPRPTLNVDALPALPVDETFARSFDGCVVLDAESDFRLAWRFNDTDATVEFAAIVRVAGWFAVGFSTDGAQKVSMM